MNMLFKSPASQNTWHSRTFHSFCVACSWLSSLPLADLNNSCKTHIVYHTAEPLYPINLVCGGSVFRQNGRLLLARGQLCPSGEQQHVHVIARYQFGPAGASLVPAVAAAQWRCAVCQRRYQSSKQHGPV